MSTTYKGLVAVHTSVVIFGLTALFSKFIQLSALDISMLRSLFAAIVIAVFILTKNKSLCLNSFKDYGVILLISLLLAIHWVTYFHAMQVSTIAVGVISLYTFPIITVFLEPLFHGEKPQIKDIISAVMVFFGVYLLVPEFSLDNQISQRILWGVFSAFIFALRNIIQGHYFTHYSAQHSMFYQTLIIFIVLLPFSAEIIPEVTIFQWGQLIILGIFFTALPHILFSFSLLNLRAKTASLVACVQVVYATIFAALLLGEEPELTTIVGGIIVISTAMYESYTAQRKKI